MDYFFAVKEVEVDTEADPGEDEEVSHDGE